MSRKKKEYPAQEVLENWRSVLQALPHMTESELLAALNDESARTREERRVDVIVRLHRKYSKLRQERELQEMLE